MKAHAPLAPRAAAGCCAAALCAAALAAPAEESGPAPLPLVAESARSIPIVRDVDVVVVGGSSAGVAAAVEAAARGARVFVAAPRPYLGEDLCATYRLWLEAGETPDTPLARAVFEAPAAPAPLPQGLPFTYRASPAPSGKHADTTPPSKLADGQWHNASTESVQYDGDATLVVDLGRRQTLARVHVLAYQRAADFEVDRVKVSVSDDGKTWTPAAEAQNARRGKGDAENEALRITADVKREARYLRLELAKGPEAGRILLGELVIEGAAAAAPAAPAAPRLPPTPMQVKRALDQALLKANIAFLTESLPTDVLVDDAGRPAGIVMATRSGRQAVRAKVIIDATPRAAVARLAGARFAPYPAGPQVFRRVVVGGTPPAGADPAPRKLPAPVVGAAGRSMDAFEYTLRLPMADGSFASFAAAEQTARDRTWHAAQADASEELFQIPPDPLVARKSAEGAWAGPAAVALDALRPAGVERLFVLGGCAAVSREAAERLLRPLALMALGARVGAAAAEEVAQAPSPAAVHVLGPPVPAAPAAAGDVRETREALRPAAAEAASPARGLPVLATYDVVVVGGGTGGAPAAIAAARKGAKTLLVEYLHGLGGVGTAGLISVYYYGNRTGFTTEADSGVAALGGLAKRGWKPEAKMEWLRRELRKAGGDLWFGALGCGALVRDGRVIGVIVATPDGRGVVLARAVVDGTGAAAIAAAAGAPCVYTDGSGIAVQGSGLPPRELGADYTNTDYTFIDDSDALDAWRAFVMGREKFKGAYDMGQLLDTRERRQILGDARVSPLDIRLARRYADTVTVAKSNFDSHGYTVHPLFFLSPPDRKEFSADVPLRCLLPRGLEGILVIGLAVSAERDAMPILRMQPDIQNEGFAAGAAAALAAKAGAGIRQIDVKALQRDLVKQGILPERVLTDVDSPPASKDAVGRAVEELAAKPESAALILANAETAAPLLRDALQRAAAPDARLAYAHILGILGDAAGAETLAEAVRSRPWDEGWKYTGMGQFGRSVSPLDSLVIALGRTRDPRALAPVLEKLAKLTPADPLSHHRAAAEALEALRDPAAAEPLARLLKKPGMTGHAMTDIQSALQDMPAGGTDTSTREVSLRELTLARALYRCGDYEGLGERILREYARDLRGHYARHAAAVLRERGGAEGRVH